jgi:hypothetical protein
MVWDYIPEDIQQNTELVALDSTNFKNNIYDSWWVT